MSHQYSKCPCQHCGGNIEFPRQSDGTPIACPHCGQETILRAPRSGKIWQIIGLILLCVAVATTAALLRSQKGNPPDTKSTATANASTSPSTDDIDETDTSNSGKPRAKRPAKPKTIKDFRISQVRIENRGDNGLIYCLGTVQNLTNTQRFDVKISLELHNRKGRTIGQTTDYLPVLEPNANWNFRALVTEPEATSAIVLDITESH